jgi:hypothetical protein
MRFVRRKILLRKIAKSCYKQCTSFVAAAIAPPLAAKKIGMAGPAAGGGRRHVDLVTIAVVGIIVVSYVVGSLTSSVETEQKLPHRY